MKISFHGAARTVTGSRHLLELDNGKKILLDCGLFQGRAAETDDANRHFGFDPASIDYLILSHAHIDHSGNIPGLVKQGFNGKIFCTSGTKDLSTIMLADSAHIQAADLQYINKRRAQQHKEPYHPIYTIEHVESALRLFHPVPLREPFAMTEDVELIFTEAGHIPGAASVNLKIREKGRTHRLTFTGDIGRPSDSILNSPDPFPQADIIICESTYGNRIHKKQDEMEMALLEIVRETCIEKGGKLIIPAFSLGRTQEVVYALNNLRNQKLLPSIPVYVDSPLSVNATGIMRAHPEYFNESVVFSLRKDPDPFGFDSLRYIQKPEESKALNRNHEPMIIISASGMAEAGRIKHHIKNNIEKEKNTILIVGYCTPESLGGKLMRGEKEVSIFGNRYPVNAGVKVMNSFSAHADYREMLDYLSCQDPNQVNRMFLVHGEYDVQLDWRETLMSAGFRNIEIPEQHSTWEIE